MIHARQWPNEARRTSRGCLWFAECVIDGATFTAQSRSGAPYALARMLVTAGIADQPMHVTSDGLKGEIRFRSIHQMAGYTIEESAAVPARLARWKPYGGKPGDQNADLRGDVDQESRGKEVLG